MRQIKPHLEEQFEMKLTAQAYDVADSAVQKMLLSEMIKDAGWHWKWPIQNWRKEMVASMYPPSIFKSQEYRFLFNSKSRSLNDSKGLLGSIVCHELLHEVFDERFVRGSINRLDFVVTPLLSEGFSEYGSLDVFTNLYLDEEKGVKQRKEDMFVLASEYQAERKDKLPLEKELEQRKWERFTRYDAHSLGYIYFREHLGEHASTQRLVNHVTAFSQENGKEFDRKVRDFLEIYV